MAYLIAFAVLLMAFGGLQLLIWAIAMAVQMVVWAAWALEGLAGMIWVALVDRPAVVRLWRKAGDRHQPVG